jgi:hypothetical protein
MTAGPVAKINRGFVQFSDARPCALRVLRTGCVKTPRHDGCEASFPMFSLLCIMGGLWLVASAMFVLALAATGRKRMPTKRHDFVLLKHAA